ncbi:ROK family protein [Streptomyces sp. NPDC090306]|uniref:ROK family transcriptional regulator n=1 Tax=Streptomyces sp. NPDC090306 TaxID=3365961 RepID=UPI003810DCF8
MLLPMHTQEGPLSRLRRDHEELVLGLLRRHGPQSRAELGQRVGLSRTTLYDIVGDLVASGAVIGEQANPEPRRRGRPVERLRLNPATGQAVGIDFARRAVHVAAANVAHEIIGSAGHAHGPDLSWSERVGLAVRLARSLGGPGFGLDALGVVGAIGVGLVGPVPDAVRRDAGEAERLVAEAFGAPVLVDNNTRLAALSECTWGAAAGCPDVLYLRLSHGVGGGLVIDGALHRGAAGLSGEFGHITAVPDGAPCVCGGRGCLETVASVGAVLAAHRAAGGAARTLPALLAAVRDGDPAARAVLAGAGRHVGAVLAAVCTAVGPEVVVLGGELAEAGEALLVPVREALDARMMPAARPGVVVRTAALGEVAGALGGIALALHESPLLNRAVLAAQPAARRGAAAPRATVASPRTQPPARQPARTASPARTAGPARTRGEGA